MTYYIAKIEILIKIPENEIHKQAYACDAVAETMRPLLREFSIDQSCFIDWRYINHFVPIPHDGTGFEYSYMTT